MNKRQGILTAVTIGILLTAVGVIYMFRRPAEETSYDSDPLAMRANEAAKYARRHNLSCNYVLLLDYSIPSGTPRLFVWDTEKNCIAARTYVMHGLGGGSTAEQPVFSNKVGSGCSSLGKFKVTKLHGSKLKRSYRLKGLERSNSNAFRRGIMIHRSKWVDTWCKNTYIPLHEPSCQGCITVSTKGMDYLERLIDSESRPLLLWSYNSNQSNI